MWGKYIYNRSIDWGLETINWSIKPLVFDSQIAMQCETSLAMWIPIKST